MKIKKIIFTLLTSFIITTGSHAGKIDLTIINAGAPGGTYSKLNDALIKDLGKFYNINVIGADSESKGHKVFQSIEDRPVYVNSRTAFFSGVNVTKKEKPLINDSKKHYIVFAGKFNRAVCVQKNKDVDTLLFGKEQSLKIASSDGVIFGKKFVAKLDAQTNSKHIMVPYNGSGKLIKGLITGDVDIIVVNQGSAIKQWKDGNINCKYTTNPSSGQGLQPLYKKMQDPWAGFKLTYTLYGEVKNVSSSFAKDLNTRISQILSDPNSNTTKKISQLGWSSLIADIEGLRKDWKESYQDTVDILK